MDYFKYDTTRARIGVAVMRLALAALAADLRQVKEDHEWAQAGDDEIREFYQAKAA
jgi:hypothetical protein